MVSFNRFKSYYTINIFIQFEERITCGLKDFNEIFYYICTFERFVISSTRMDVREYN